MVQHTIPSKVLSMNGLISLIITLLLWSACGKKQNKETTNMELTKPLTIAVEDFGTLPSGEKATLYTFTNANGVKASITDYGGIVTSLWVPDKNGELSDVVLGYDDLDGYVKDSPYFGAIVGRYGNRIAKAKFSLDGVEYPLAQNNGPNHLHGGIKGFDKVIWKAESFEGDEEAGLKLQYTSADMEEGYPGNLRCEVIYTLNNKNQLMVDFKATTDKKTVVNLTNHSYFNLTGNPNNTILDHELELVAHGFLPVDSTMIPTGELRQVENTPFDFLLSTRIGDRIDGEDLQLIYGKGYDHCWIFNEQTSRMKYAGAVYEPTSGRQMTLYTTEVGVQFYTGNFLNESLVGKGEIAYQPRTGFCLETQHYPDSPNKPEFPTTELNPGEEYRSSTIFEFSVL